MATAVEYVGPADTRIVMEQTFASAGFVSQGSVTWNKANGYEVVLPDDVALWLLAFGGEFQVSQASNFAEFWDGILAGSINSVNGMFTPRYGLNSFRQSTAAMRNIVFLGDSIIEGYVNNTKGPVRSFRDQLAVEQPALVQHAGFQAPWRTTERAPWIGAWSFTGTWTNSNSVLAPYSTSVIGANNAPTSTNGTAIWTRPSGMSVTEIDLFFVDVQIFGQGFSYSVNGGSTWVDVPSTSPASLTLRKLTITGLSNPATFRVRTLRADGTTAGTIPALVGISVRGGTSGVAIHNIGRAGSGYNSTFGSLSSHSSPRSWEKVLEFIDPDLTFILFSNDDNPSGQADLFTVMDEVATKMLALGGDVVLVQQMDQNNRNQGLEDAKGVKLKELAVANGFGFINMADRWGSYSTAQAAGLMADDFHPTNLGGDRIAADFHRLLRVS